MYSSVPSSLRLPLIIYAIICAGLLYSARGHLVRADDVEIERENNNYCADGDDVLEGEHKQQEIPQQQQQQLRKSHLCSSSRQHQSVTSTLYKQSGISLQAYKPNAPHQTTVCQGVESGDKQTHNFAHRWWWRSSYGNVVPLIIHANIYSCGGATTSLSSNNAAITMEVWQPRPDGTYSSLRSGIDEGDCRATVPAVVNNRENEFSNFVGLVQFQTLSPGSPGLLGGLIPSSNARDYPPYGQGIIHMLVNIDGYHPFISQLSMSDLNDWLLLEKHDSRGSRFRVNGSMKNANSNLEIQSVHVTTQAGYDIAFEVKVDIFVDPKQQGKAAPEGSSPQDLFCSSNHHGLFKWMAYSFFKEPIAICFPSLLDFFEI